MIKILQDIMAERHRQISEEGFSLERDRKEYPDGQLALAAACYAGGPQELFRLGPRLSNGSHLYLPLWPWSRVWWKPKDRRRDLIRAAALIVAELQRMEAENPRGN